MDKLNSVLSLKHNVQRMLKALKLLGDHDWIEPSRRRLRKLYQRLGAMSLAPVPTLDPSVEGEFYAIVESHPKLRQASQLVFKEELVEICSEALASFAHVDKKRWPIGDELDRFLSVKREYEKANDELNQLRHELLAE